VSYLSAVLIVLLFAGAAALVSLMVNRLVTRETRSKHYEVGVQVFLQLGVMFSVLLAFVFNEVWSEYNTAAQAINGECGALHGASILASSLPDHAGQPLNQAIKVYVATVVHKEWPLMVERRQSQQAIQDFRRILDMAAQLSSPRPGGGPAVQNQVLSLLSAAHSYRETRAFQITQCLPVAMWIVLEVLAFLLIALVQMSTVEGVSHMLFASVFTACTVMVLVLVRMLDFPFEGATRLPDTDFVRLLGQVSSLMSGP
jgi:hypothetical protein